jgi:YVTN family beta-propeller protein
MANCNAVLNGFEDQLRDCGLPEKHRSAAGLVEQTIHSDEGLTGSQICGRKGAVCGKRVVKAKRDEQRLADDIQVRKSALIENHISVVRPAGRNSHTWRPERPPQAKGLPHFCTTLLLAGMAFLGTLHAATLRYPSPIELTLSPDGARLLVLCEGTDELTVLDAHTGKIEGRAPVGRVPKGLWLSGRYAYIANSWSDTVSVVDTDTLQVTRTLKTGFEPNAVFADHAAATIYTANRIGNDISVIDLASGVETRRLAAGRGASYLTPSPDGRSLYCTHIYPNIGLHRTPAESEITVVDAEQQIVRERQPLHNVAGVFHVAFSSDGRLGIACQLRPKNLIPLAHVEHGSVFGDSLTLFGADVGEPVQVLIDELERYYTMPFGVVISQDKSAAYISTTGANSVTVIDIQRLLEFVRAASPRERSALANDLSASAHFVAARIPVGRAPKGIALSPDGSLLYVANRLDDTVSVIDTAARKVVRTIELGGPPELTPQRRGEQLFFDARFAFHNGFSCANCHLESTFDGLQWDLEPDGFGVDIVDNRLLEDVDGTEPFKWNGGNPDLETECGPRTEKYFYRSQSYSREELGDLVGYIKSMPLRPNRYRLPNGELTAAQERGKDIFERTRKKDGTPIPEANQCGVCHAGRHYTNQKQVDVGSGKWSDRSPIIDVPQLTNIALTAPYLHDGSARSLEEIWTVFNPKDTHGVTNDLVKDELNDLIEYLKTL